MSHCRNPTPTLRALRSRGCLGILFSSIQAGLNQRSHLPVLLR